MGKLENLENRPLKTAIRETLDKTLFSRGTLARITLFSGTTPDAVSDIASASDATPAEQANEIVANALEPSSDVISDDVGTDQQNNDSAVALETPSEITPDIIEGLGGSNQSFVESAIIPAGDVVTGTQVNNVNQNSISTDGVIESIIDNSDINDRSNDIAFVQDNVDGYEVIVQELEDQGFQTVVLSSEASGLDAIDEALTEANGEISNIHLITHGSDARVELGLDSVTNDNLEEFGEVLAKHNLDELLIYGCKVTETSKGEEFINSLASLGGIDIAASNDDTGGLSGDRVLESSVGEISTIAADFTLEARLATPVTANDDVIAGLEDQPITFNLSANNGNGADVVGSNTTYRIITAPTNGTITSFNASTGVGIFVPNADFNGTINGTYGLSDFDASSTIDEYELVDTIITGTNGGVDSRESISSNGQYYAINSGDQISISTIDQNSTNTGLESNNVLNISPPTGAVFTDRVGFGLQGNQATIVAGIDDGPNHSLVIYKFDITSPPSIFIPAETIPLNSENGGHVTGVYVSDDGNTIVAGTAFTLKSPDGLTNSPTPLNLNQAGAVEVFNFDTDPLSGTFNSYVSTGFLGNPNNEVSDSNGSGDHNGISVRGETNAAGGITLIIGAYNDSDDVPGGSILIWETNSSTATGAFDFSLIAVDRQGASNGISNDEYGQTTAVDATNTNLVVAQSGNAGGGLSIYLAGTEVLANFDAGNVDTVTVHNGIIVTADRGFDSAAPNSVKAYQYDEALNTLTLLNTFAAPAGSVDFGRSLEFIGEELFVGAANATYVYGAATTNDTGNFTLNIANVNDSPTAVNDGAGPDNTVGTADDTYVEDEGNVLVVPASNGLLANDSDIDGDSLTVVSVDQPNEGLVVFSGDGSFTFTPTDPNFNGSFSFRYTVDDQSGATNSQASAFAFVRYNPVNDAPTTVDDGLGPDNTADTADDSYSLVQGSKLTVGAANGLLANDTDVDGDTLIVVAVTEPPEGTVMFSSDGSFMFTPNDPNFVGSISFTYTADDQSGAANSQSTANVFIRYTPAPPPPPAPVIVEPVIQAAAPVMAPPPEIVQVVPVDLPQVAAQAVAERSDPFELPEETDVEVINNEFVINTVQGNNAAIAAQFGLDEGSNSVAKRIANDEIKVSNPQTVEERAAAKIENFFRFG